MGQVFRTWLGKGVLDMTPSNRRTKRINKTSSELNFVLQRTLLLKGKRQPIEWEKIFPNNIFDKRSVFRFYNQCSQLNVKRQVNNLKMGKIFE